MPNLVTVSFKRQMPLILLPRSPRDQCLLELPPIYRGLRHQDQRHTPSHGLPCLRHFLLQPLLPQWHLLLLPPSWLLVSQSPRRGINHRCPRPTNQEPPRLCNPRPRRPTQPRGYEHFYLSFCLRLPVSLWNGQRVQSLLIRLQQQHLHALLPAV